MHIGLAIRLVQNPKTAFFQNDGGDVPDPLSSHPGYLIPNGPAPTNVNGWPSGDHYTLEVDPNDVTRMIVEPGETTRVMYCTTKRDVFGHPIGWTRATIAAAEDMGETAVSVHWLMGPGNTMGYGFRSDMPFHWEGGGYGGDALGFEVYAAVPNGESWHVKFEAGSNTNARPDARNTPINGESALHPVLFSFYGDPDVDGRPQMNTDVNLTLGNTYSGLQNWVFEGWDYLAEVTVNANGSENILFMDHKSLPAGDGHDFLSYVKTATWYCCDYEDIHLGAPKDGTNWTTDFQHRVSGLYSSYCVGKLFWHVDFEKCGWSDNYELDASTNFDPLSPSGHPPSYLSHNQYEAEQSLGTTMFKSISTRAAGAAVQQRGGGVFNLNIFGDNNQGGNFGAGTVGSYNVTDVVSPSGTWLKNSILRGDTSGKQFENTALDPDSYIASNKFNFSTGDADQVQFTPGETVRAYQSDGVTATGDSFTFLSIDKVWASYSFVDYALTMSAGNKRRDPEGLAGVLFRAWNGLGSTDMVFGLAGGVIIANMADPADPTDIADKSNILFTADSGAEASSLTNAFHHDVTIVNWGQVPNQNFGSSAQTQWDEVTFGAYVDLQHKGVPVGTTNTDDALDYLKTNFKYHSLLAEDIWNFAASRTGRPLLGHAAGALAVFDPDIRADGLRTDIIANWKINGKNDLPIDGDDLRISDGAKFYNFQTFRFGNINFGTNADVKLSGGLISATTTQGAANIALSRGAQFWLKGTHSNDMNIILTGGRLGVEGVVSDGLSVSLSGHSEFLIKSGATCKIGVGKTLSLTGENAKAGFDGQDAGIANLTVEGTLAFAPASGTMPTIRVFRSGHYGIEELENGALGQPREPNVTGSVVLESGSTVTVDSTGLAAGTYILAENITDMGTTLPANVTITNNRLELSI